MKIILIAATFILGSQAFACSPALPSVAQAMNLERVLGSESFKRELNLARQQDLMVQIESIQLEQSIDVVLSNGCVISSVMTFKLPEMPGMCPRFIAVVSKTHCF